MFNSITQRLRRPGDTAPVLVERAQQLEVGGRLDEAAAMLERALALDPRYGDALTAKERIAEKSGNGGAAIAMWSQLIERFPDDVGYRIRCELVRLRTGDERVAARELTKLAQAEPHRADLAEHAARAARWLERAEEALHWFRAAASRQPDRPELGLEAVRELMRLDRFEEAESALSALKPRLGGDAGFRELQGALSARREAATSTSLKAQGIDPPTPAQTVDPQTSAQRTPEAALPAPPPSPTQRALIAAEEGELAQAHEILAHELARNPAFPIARWRARIAHAFGDFDEAIAQIAPQVDASAPVALADARLAVRARIDAERVDDAWAELRRHEAGFAARDLAEERADLLRADLRLDEELALLRSRVKADPLDETFASRLADALLNRGDAEGTAPIIEAWSRRRPGARVWAHKRLHHSWCAHRDWSRLVADSQQLLDNAAPQLQTHLVMDHIRVVRKSGDFERTASLLADFEQRLPSLGLSRREGLALACEIAHELTWLGAHAEARPRLERLRKEPMSRRMRDELLRLCSANESYGGGDLGRLVETRNAISNPRHHLQVTQFAEAAPALSAEAASAPRVLVLLHLFHGDLWPELRDRLARLDRATMQLAVGIGERVGEDVIADLRQFSPQARLVRIENRGFDVGGHWQVLDQIDLSGFDLALLLQTKKSSHTRVGRIWRDHLVDALVGSPARWKDNLRLFCERPQLGLIGSAWHQSSFHPWSTPEMRDVLAALGMPLGFDALKSTHRFVTGTMLLMRASLLAEMHRKMRLPFERLEDLSLARRSDNSRAHAMERAFGMYAAWRGYEACWRP